MVPSISDIIHAQEDKAVRRNRSAYRVLLLIIVAVMVTLIVLVGSFELLPVPPGSPTPTAPYVLDRPEGLPRLPQ